MAGIGRKTHNFTLPAPSPQGACKKRCDHDSHLSNAPLVFASDIFRACSASRRAALSRCACATFFACLRAKLRLIRNNTNPIIPAPSTLPAMRQCCTSPNGTPRRSIKKDAAKLPKSNPKNIAESVPSTENRRVKYARVPNLREASSVAAPSKLSGVSTGSSLMTIPLWETQPRPPRAARAQSRTQQPLRSSQQTRS